MPVSSSRRIGGSRAVRPSALLPFPRAVFALALPLLALGACSDDDDDSSVGVARGPQPVGSAMLQDLDGDGTVGAGDQIVVRFDRAIEVQNGLSMPFKPAAADDSFGSNATFAAGQRTDEAVITLGSGARLRARGRFAEGGGTGAPSGIAIEPSGAIVGADDRVAVTAHAPRDLTGGFTERQLAVLGTDVRTIAAADLDEDGDLDLVTGSATSPPRVFVNDGNAQFTDSGLDLGAAGVSSIAIGDLDGDGDLDLVLARDPGLTTVLHRVGAGTYTVNQTLTGNRSPAVALADLDGDTDLDLVRAMHGGEPDAIWWKEGGSFVPGPDLGQAGETRTVAVADTDGDGDRDVLIGRSGQSRIWRNDGNATFVEGQSLGSGNVHAIAAGDVDCDGDVDLLLAGRDPSRVFTNDGGSFAAAPQLANAATDGIVLADFDGDGRLEAFAANANGQSDELWRIGQGNALSLGGPRFDDGTTTTVVAGDFDRDGDVDLVTAGPDETPRLYLNATSSAPGEATFVPGTVRTGEGRTLRFALGDVDRDGDLDLVEPQGNGRAMAIWKNDGRGAFAERQLLQAGPIEAALADVDGDGDLDLLETGPTSGLRLWRNDGNGITGSPVTIGGNGGEVLEVGDIDRDGDVDLLHLRTAPQPAELWENDGEGNFSLRFIPTMPATGANAGVLCDLDGDGDLDIGLATSSGAYLMRNDDGDFPVTGTVGNATLYSIACGDFDRDGDSDLVAGGSAGYTVWRNEGTGGFPNPFGPSSLFTTAIAVGDLDGDGDLDVLRGGPHAPDSLDWGDGAGGFTSATTTFSAGPTNDLALADLDCDGDLDVVAADNSATGGIRVWLQR